jgi:hypothetical protein
VGDVNIKYSFDEEATQELVLRWQKTKCERTLEDIFRNADGMIRALIFSRGIYQYMETAEVLSSIQFKLWKGLPRFDPTKGRLYSFLTRSIHNRISTLQADTYKSPNHESLDEEQWENMNHATDDDGYGVEDLSYRIMQVKTICTDEHELEAQRWLVKSFISSGFHIRRHDAANAMSAVYGINRVRARQLHDYTLLEVRRAVIDGTTPPTVTTNDLCGTRQKALRKYANELTQAEFSLLVFLMRNLSSSIIEDVSCVLYGYTTAKPLFG